MMMATRSQQGFPYSSAWDRPGFLLWHATMRWQRAAAAELAPLGLTHAQFRLLCAVAWLKEHACEWPSQRELAEHSGVDAMMTSQVVRALERGELIERFKDAHDARIRRLRCTQAGRAMAMRAIKRIEKIDDEFFGLSVDRAASIEALRAMAGRDEDGVIINPRWNRDIV
jgi:DNA-binding MarR family transcriptional regulator